MLQSISHDRKDESIESKARWFQSLAIEQRMELFCEFTDMILENNPNIVNSKDAKTIVGRIQVLSLKDLINSKIASGRDIDLEDVRILNLEKKELNGNNNQI